METVRAKLFWTNYPEIACWAKEDDSWVEDVLDRMPVRLSESFSGTFVRGSLDEEDEENFFCTTVAWEFPVAGEIEAVVCGKIAGISDEFPLAKFRLELTGDDGCVNRFYIANGLCGV